MHMTRHSVRPIGPARAPAARPGRVRADPGGTVGRRAGSRRSDGPGLTCAEGRRQIADRVLLEKGVDDGHDPAGLTAERSRRDGRDGRPAGVGRAFQPDSVRRSRDEGLREEPRAQEPISIAPSRPRVQTQGRRDPRDAPGDYEWNPRRRANAPTTITPEASRTKADGSGTAVATKPQLQLPSGLLASPTNWPRSLKSSISASE